MAKREWHWEWESKGDEVGIGGLEVSKGLPGIFAANWL